MARINMKSTSFAKVFWVVLVIALGMQIKGSMAQAQSTCANQLGSLNVCAPFVLPGTQNSAPSAECCGALQAVEHGCLCNTFRVASELPSACKLPALSCGV
ncbi:protein MEN-8-like [Amaranthus tricolor]|uniref:protein MEN-8-like n=1 Tax=Amaranthus tricolor TaxID=29722 RepID=UPI002585D384|nr:protein MEN-8-like [Amaranthus tricolor]